MTTRIGLFTNRQKKKKGRASSQATYVEIDTAEQLAAKITEIGGKRAGLMCRDREGNTTLEGKMMVPSELTAEHLKWLTAKPKEFQTRAVFYD